jgi:molybdopterin-guanine dinucleotide biosynthesis protein A
MTAPLKGLLLAGGHSKRMQRDKATLDYGGQGALERTLAMLAPLVTEAFVSIRADQANDPRRAVHACLADRIPDLGPIGGIHAALHADPQAAWLVLAIDLPFLDVATLQQLISSRVPQKLATAFLGSHDGKPEPLCAIFEPTARLALNAWIDAGQRCPRAFLAQHDAQLLTLANPRALDNINTGEEYAEAQSRLAPRSAAASAPAATSGAALRPLTIQYFALLREQAGRSQETLESGARTARELYAELSTLRGLTLLPAQLRVAVNEEFSDWDCALGAGDRIAFLPPVAGG